AKSKGKFSRHGAQPGGWTGSAKMAATRTAAASAPAAPRRRRRHRGRNGPWRNIGGHDAQRPFDGIEPHTLDGGVVPCTGIMSQRRIENPAFAVLLGPGNGVRCVGGVDAARLHVESGGIQSHQHAALGGRKIFDLVELVMKLEYAREILHAR